MLETLLPRIESHLRRKQYRQLTTLLLSLDHTTIADAIDALDSGRQKCFSLLPPEFQAEVAVRLSHHTKEYLLPRLPNDAFARFLHFSNEDDATDLLQFLAADHREKVLNLMQKEKRRKIEKLLAFGAETAGGLMDLNFIAVDADATVAEAMKRLHSHTPRMGQAPMVIGTDSGGHAVGFLAHRSLLFAHPQRRVRELLRPVPAMTADADREHVMDRIAHERSTLGCVVDEQQRPIGVIHLGDLLTVASAEATEDVFRFAGVDSEETIHDGVLTKVRRRYIWLILNLGTAFLAAAVVSLFESTIARVAILAAFMPMVAGQGGNAATQALAVVVRGLSQEDTDRRLAVWIVLRESVAGMLNGLVVGLVAAGAVILVGSSTTIAIILGIAMALNMCVAGFFGALIPIVLKALRVDPAIASSIFVTTATDVFGFFAFLGLASLVLT